MTGQLHFEDTLELAIEAATLNLIKPSASSTPEERRKNWELLRALIASRPKETVKRMEDERGLTR